MYLFENNKTTEDHNQECCGSLFALFQDNKHETLVEITRKNRLCFEEVCIQIELFDPIQRGLQM
jgi:hypothetical protein